MGLFAQMDAHVFREVCVSGEGFGADVAAVGAHAGVYDCVFAEVGSSGESFVAF